MENREWLKSLSDRQLAEEIYYGSDLARDGRHREFHRRELEEALAEKRKRDQ